MEKEIIYDPLLTIKQMAEQAGLYGTVNGDSEGAQVRAIHSYFLSNSLDYNADRHNALRKIVKDLIKEAKRRKIENIYKYVANEMSCKFNVLDSNKGNNIEGVSVALVSYLDSSKERKSTTRKSNRQTHGVKQSFNSSVQDSDEAALLQILRLYLPRKKTFDCDLTFGKGGFYTHIPRPKFCFDENPDETLGVSKLNETSNITPGRFNSVVIDLPAEVNANKNSEEAFQTLEDLYETYVEMIELAYRMLKKGGILVFKASEIVIRQSELSWTNHLWISDHAINTATALDFELLDEILVVKDENYKLSQGTLSEKYTTKHFGEFLVFKKI